MFIAKNNMGKKHHADSHVFKLSIVHWAEKRNDKYFFNRKLRSTFYFSLLLKVLRGQIIQGQKFIGSNLWN